MSIKQTRKPRVRKDRNLTVSEMAKRNREKNKEFVNALLDAVPAHKRERILIAFNKKGDHMAP